MRYFFVRIIFAENFCRRKQTNKFYPVNDFIHIFFKTLLKEFLIFFKENIRDLQNISEEAFVSSNFPHFDHSTSKCKRQIVFEAAASNTQTAKDKIAF